MQQAIANFTHYYTNAWIPNAMFWCQWLNTGPRTTNHAEGWHNRLATVFDNVEHPTIVEFLKKMQAEHLVAANEAELLRNGKLPALRRRRYRESEARIDTQKQTFQAFYNDAAYTDAIIEQYATTQAHNIAHLRQLNSTQANV